MYQPTQAEFAFSGAENLKKVNFLGEWKGSLPIGLFKGSGIEEIEIPEGVTNLAGALDGTPNLKNIYLPTTYKGGTFDFSYTHLDKHAEDSKKEGLTLWVYENSEGHTYLEKIRAEIIAKNAENNTKYPVFEIKFRGTVPPTDNGTGKDNGTKTSTNTKTVIIRQVLSTNSRNNDRVVKVLPKTSATTTHNTAAPVGMAVGLAAAGLVVAKRRKN